ncbi:uncharacterized protein CCOS01_02814 [Colletotrichum costaricense]|uniref:Uncharacterized protein n=1 Tax=Colletotrichum costaricense TaxID=1209916 RepID=A0AAI9Z440_9PEZI|nr:uncharacterized protein CCOS01_02814 [Colletotrichum costaricense]KAK1534062.1 hypothetical protein CCOS01_02814 [Colletotrichum costaricense]
MSWKASLHRHLGPDVGLGIPAGQECSSYAGSSRWHFLSRNATPARFCARKLPLLCPSFSLANVNDSGWYHDSSRLPSRIEGREGLTSGGESALARPSPESSKGQDISIYRQRAKEISEEANQQNHLVTYDQQIEPPHMDAWTISHDASGGEHNPSIHYLENREQQ